MASDEFASGKGWSLARGMIAAVAVAFVIVSLRVVAKLKLRQFGIDDVLMGIALGATIASTVFLAKSADQGFGADLSKLPFEHVSLVLKYTAIQIPLVTISTGIARSSFVLYLCNILGRKRLFQIILWSVMVLQLAANIVSAVLPLSICGDARVIWDPTVKTTCGDQVAVVNFSYFSSSVNTASDFFLAVFPMVIFWNLHLKWRIKASLIVLMSLGIVAMVASIIKTTQLDKIPSVVNTGANGGISLIRWGYTENVIIIITSSVPCVRPLFISSVRKVSSATRSWSHELTAAGRRSKNASSSKSTSRNTWSKNRGSGSGAGAEAEAGTGSRSLGHQHQEVSAAKPDDGELGDGVGAEQGQEEQQEQQEQQEHGQEQQTPSQQWDLWPYQSYGHSHGYSTSGSVSAPASWESRPGSKGSSGITKQVDFSVQSSSERRS